jgi:transcriptional regulator with XRE-family HTH domain
MTTLRERRTNLGISQQAVADDLRGVSRDALGKIERGTQAPEFRQIAELARFYSLHYPGLGAETIVLECWRAWVGVHGEGA